MTVHLKIELDENQRKSIAWYYNDDQRRVRYMIRPASPDLCKVFLEQAAAYALGRAR